MIKNSRDLKKITIEDKVYDTIIKNDLIQDGDKIVLGVSGGPDSICMLNILYKLKEQLSKFNKINYTMIVATVNHCIRKEASEEAEFVKNVCNNLNIKFRYLEVDVPKMAKANKQSEELCGRNVRYEFFKKVMQEEGANKIAVAHNSDDVIETILINLSRGTGIKGLTGISYKNEEIIRPLLDIKKSEINDYCKENNLEPRIDKTNFETIYTRNKIRNNIIPILKENLGESFCNSVLKTREILIKEEEFLSQYTNNIINSAIIEDNIESIIFNYNGILKEHEAIIIRCIREIIYRLMGNLDNVSYVHVQSINKILESNIKGKSFIFGKRFEIDILKKDIAIIKKLS